MNKANEIVNYRENVGKLDNYEVRKWYNYHDQKILVNLDKTLSIKEQAIQAHYLRNKYRTQARKLMKDRKLAEYLNNNRKNLPFEYYEEKYYSLGFRKSSLYNKIMESSMRSNSNINKQLGIS